MAFDMKARRVPRWFKPPGRHLSSAPAPLLPQVKCHDPSFELAYELDLLAGADRPTRPAAAPPPLLPGVELVSELPEFLGSCQVLSLHGSPSRARHSVLVTEASAPAPHLSVLWCHGRSTRPTPLMSTVHRRRWTACPTA